MWWRRGARRMLNISTNGTCWALKNKKRYICKETNNFKEFEVVMYK